MERAGTTTFSLKDPRRHRPKPQWISPSCPPRAPRAPPWEVWTTPCRGTTPPARSSASLTSCPTTPGTPPARSLGSRGPCTASPQKCSAPARLLPHCRWTAADTTATCPTPPLKWTKAPCGSSLTDGAPLGCGSGTEDGDAGVLERVEENNRVRATSSTCVVIVYLLTYLFFVFHILLLCSLTTSLCWNRFFHDLTQSVQNN